MNSKSSDVDFMKLSNEMLNNLASPRKLTTKEKISQFSKDFLFEGKFKDATIPNTSSNREFFKLFHSKSINDKIKNRFVYFYSDFIHKKNKNSENNIVVSTVKNTIERIIINNKVEKINNSNSAKNQLLLTKRRIVYNLVNDMKRGRSRNSNSQINQKSIQKNFSVPHIINTLSPNSFLQNKDSTKSKCSREHFQNWDKVRNILIFTSPRKLFYSNSQSSIKRNLFINSSNKPYRNLFDSTSHSLKGKIE